MKTFVPAYYRDFHCISSNCRHTCCSGWEIDIDKETLELYRCLPDDELHIMSHIDCSCDSPHIRMDEEERCPFLGQHNLCRIIQKYGDGAISDICYDHPRFRNFFSDHVEMGIGMACEEAARVILSWKHPFSLAIWEDDGEGDSPLSCEESDLLQFRNAKIAMAAIAAAPDVASLKEQHFLLSLESMLPEWKDSLNALLCRRKRNFSASDQEKILSYLYFRHIPSALCSNYTKEEYADFAEFSLGIIKSIYERTDVALMEICREYSAEIEYSDENIFKIMDFIRETGFSHCK